VSKFDQSIDIDRAPVFYSAPPAAQEQNRAQRSNKDRLNQLDITATGYHNNSGDQRGHAITV
jgi:hypothetical protein